MPMPMPIRPENRARYPSDWKDISHRIRFGRAEGRCECRGECGRDHYYESLGSDKPNETSERCRSLHGEPHPHTGSTVVLTTAHLDHTPEHCDDDNLRAMCQRCHLAYDADHHAQSRYYYRRCTRTTDMFDR